MTSLELNQSIGLSLKRAEHFNIFIDVFYNFFAGSHEHQNYDNFF